MKFTIETDVIRSALGVVKIATATRTTLPILSNVKLEAQGGSLTLSATDLDLFISERVSANVEREGGVTAPTGLLAQFVSRINSKQVSLELAGSSLEIRGGETVAILETLPAEEFPAAPTNSGKSIGCDVAAITEPFRKIAHAMMVVDPSRYNLMGINLSPRDGGGSFVATNGVKLAVVRGEKLSGENVIAPDVFVRALLKLDLKGPATVSLDQGCIRVAVNGTQIHSKLIEARFPNWTAVVPDKSGDKVFSCYRKDLIEALQTCALLTSVTLPGVDLTGMGKEIEVKSVSDTARATARVMGSDLAGQPDITIRFNARSMLETLAVLSGEEVRIACTDESSPIIIEEEDFKAVIMPLSR